MKNLSDNDRGDKCCEEIKRGMGMEAVGCEEGTAFYIGWVRKASGKRRYFTERASELEFNLYPKFEKGWLMVFEEVS